MSEKLSSIKNNTMFKTAVISVLGISGLCMLLDDAGMTPVRRTVFFGIMILLIVILEYGVLRLIESDGERAKRDLKYAGVFGLLFGIATDAGYQMKVSEMTLPGVKGKFVIFVTGLLLSFLFLPVTYRIFRFIGGRYGDHAVSEPGRKKSLRFFLISWVFLQICWLPAFLAYYPAIMSYDFHRQFGEAVKGYIWFYEYQPLVHTFLIRMFYLLGMKLGNVGTGMAVFALLQSNLLAVSISAGLTYAYRKAGIFFSAACLLMFALLPFNPVLAISMTKDILFCVFFIAMLLILFRTEGKLSAFVIVSFVLIGAFNILFRNNALYALLFLIPAFAVVASGKKKKIILMLLAVVMLVLGAGSKTLIRTSMNAIGGSKIEMYSVPIMQMVRVVRYQENNLTDAQREILHRYISDDSWGDYFPPIADSFKSIAARDREYEWTVDHGTLIRDYVKIGMAYPNDYIDAFLALTLGYWFVDDTSHAEMLGYGDDTNLGLLYTFNASTNDAFPEGIPSRSYLPSVRGMYSRIVNGNSYYDWPVISFLMRPAFYFWIFVLVLFAAVYKRSRRSILIFAYPVFYFMTMLLGPCVNFRYMYPYIVIMPILVSFILSENDRYKGKRKKGSKEAK